MMANIDKTLLLGTAQWGWTVSRKKAFQVLDTWLTAGFKQLDLATNYPINKIPADFRAAENIVLEYIQAHGLRDLKITLKIGSLNNLRTPEINLAPSFILMMAEEYKRLFGENLHSLMVHWDNRSDEKPIGETLQALRQIQQHLGFRPGLSGIKFPESYIEANQAFELAFDIQLKHNILQSDLPRYAPFYKNNAAPKHRLFAYGLNAGGVKLDGPYPTESTFLARGGDPKQAHLKLEKLQKLIPKWNIAFARPPIQKMNHIGLIFAGLNPNLSGLVLGLSSRVQLQGTLDYWRNLETFDYSDVFTSLQKHFN